MQTHKTFTEDLNKIVQWLVSEGITTAAIESTGVYWLNLYLMLEEAGIEPYLVNSRHVKNVTRRKKDDTDAIWLQKLHCCGLLPKSFQPDEETRVLLTYVRQRRNLVLISSDSVRRMQKALELMNIKLHTVISDIFGKTGLLMVKAIISGERNVDELIKLKDPRIEASDEDIKKSLAGIWKKEYLFTLKQAYEEYLFYLGQIQACEEMIVEQLLKQVAIVLDGEVPDVRVKKKAKKNQLVTEIRPLLKTIVGVDLCRIDGISEISSLELVLRHIWGRSPGCLIFEKGTQLFLGYQMTRKSMQTVLADICQYRQPRGKSGASGIKLTKSLKISFMPGSVLI